MIKAGEEKKKGKYFIFFTNPTGCPRGSITKYIAFTNGRKNRARVPRIPRGRGRGEIRGFVVPDIISVETRHPRRNDLCTEEEPVRFAWRGWGGEAGEIFHV